ncbi:hypothetical protein TNCV_1360281 [Trichonephila clavipes]|nr:hypothetical protein TNCV_1360281 [Trichonephila clavipes]
MEWYEQQSAVLLSYCCSRESQTLQQYNEVVQCVRFRMLHGSHKIFGYLNNRVSERGLIPIDSDKQRSAEDRMGIFGIVPSEALCTYCYNLASFNAWS